MNRLFRTVYLPPSGVLSWRRVGVLAAILFALGALVVPLSRITQPAWLVYVLVYVWAAATLIHAVLMAGASMLASTLAELRKRAGSRPRRLDR